jgi:cytochrome c oxidase assembly factor CtaG
MTHVGSAWPFLGGWHINILVDVIGILGVGLLCYLVARRTSRTIVPWSIALVFSVALLSSNVQATALTSYRSHMIEHILVIMVIAPLVASGMRLRLSRSSATWGLIAFTILVPLYHLTRLGAWVMQQSGGHVVELMSFAVVGVWFWLPVYGMNRALNDLERLTFTFIALPVISTTGLVLWSSNSRSISSVGMAMPSMTVGDLRNGGLVMIEWGTALMFAHLVFLAYLAAHRWRANRQPVGIKYVEV